ncbi:MAG: hypothetical protein ACKVZH_06745 [Blastocatellia bacterium]
MENLFPLLKSLREIAEQADKQRLSVWVTQFETEFPDLAEEVKYCARMSSPTTVLAYLRERDQRFALLAFIPNIEPVIAFLMEFINERSNNDDSDTTVLPVINRARPTASRARRLRAHT